MTQASDLTASPDGSANTNPAERKHSTPPTTTAELEKQILNLIQNELYARDNFFPSNHRTNTELAHDITTLIHTEATRIALEAIGEDDPNIHDILAIENQNSLRQFQRTKLKALTEDKPSV